MFGHLQLQWLQSRVENFVCDINMYIGIHVAFLQRHFGSTWGLCLLAIDCVFSARNAHCTEQDSEVLSQMGGAQSIERILLDRFSSRRRWIHSRHHYGAQDIQAFQVRGLSLDLI